MKQATSRSNRWFCLVLSALVLSVTSSAVAAPATYWLTVTGAQQGKLKGDGATPTTADKMAVSGWSYSVSSSAGGTRSHTPLCIVKNINGSTPQLLHAMITGESLSVVLDFWQTSPSGTQQNTHRIRLTNGRASRQAQTGSGGMEEVCFTFQQITHESLIGGTVVSDTSTR